MAVKANESGMSSGESSDKRDSSHEFNSYLDRQIQNNLLQIAEDLDAEGYEQKLSKSGNNLKSGAKSAKVDSRAEDVTGWIPDATFVARRYDSGKTDAKPPPKDTFIHPWKDYRAKKEETFVFKHYVDRKKYIDQYRSEHSCHNARNASGVQTDYSRRIAFQTTPAQTPAQVPVQVSMQQVQQVWSPQPTNQGTLQYSNRRDQLGTLVTQVPGPGGTCSCSKPNHSHVDPSSQSHKYKLTQNSAPFARVNMETRSPAESDNSSETGDSRCRTPIRRINSAASSRGRTAVKQPTKICVPATSQRTYPIQALTMQQNGKTETKPLDNLACVAPDKQSVSVERKQVEPLGLAMKVQSLNDLLTANEAPLRGYALPKTTQHPNPSANSEGSEASDVDSDLLVLDSDNNNDAVSIDQLSTCPLGADIRVKARTERTNAQLLQMFLKDPVLSRLNQRPPVKEPVPEIDHSGTEREKMTLNAPKVFGSDSFLIPQNDVDTMLRVNMWNPIVSTPPHPRREQTGQNFRTVMTQVPFKKQGQEPKRPTTMPATGNGRRTSENSSGKQDFFNPVKKIKLSITRLNNGVSFCRTQVQSDNKNSKKTLSQTRGDNSASKENKGKIEASKSNVPVEKHMHNTKSEANNSNGQNTKQKLAYDPYVDRLSKAPTFDKKMTFPLPQVKIFESIPIISTPVHCNHAKGGAELPNLDLSESQRQSRQSSAQPRSDVSEAKNIKDNTDIEKYRQRSASTVKSVTSTLSVENHNVYVNMDMFKEDKSTDTKEKPAELVQQERKADMEQKAKAAELALSLLQMNVENGKGGQTLVAKGTRVMEEMHSRNITNGYKPHQKVVKKPAVANGVVTFSSPKSTKQRQLRQEQALDGLTWAEKLELLRSINKPKDKPKPKRQKIKYIKADSESNPTLESSEHEELYEQRRIKHLVEQARLKGGKQFDWVYEARMRARGIDWNSGKGKTDDSANKTDSSTEKVNTMVTSSGDSSTQSDEDVEEDADRKLGKYGIYVPPRGVKQKLMSALSVQRSRTFVAP